MNIQIELYVGPFDRWTPAHVQAHPTWIFLYGDNDIHKGTKGQACIRYAGPNVVGIPTKRFPSTTENAYYSDTTLEEHQTSIHTALYETLEQTIQCIATTYSLTMVRLVVPKEPWGTGLSALPIRAPRTFATLRNEWNRWCYTHQVSVVEVVVGEEEGSQEDVGEKVT